MRLLRFPPWVDRFDLAGDRAFDRLRGRPQVDWIFYAASAVGDNSLIWHLSGAVGALRSEHHVRAAVRLSVALAIESALVNGLLKSLVRRQRPVLEELRPRYLRHPRTSSFPSGHASAAFTAAGILSDGDPLAPLFYAMAVVVASSRIFARVHHPSDVVAGALLGVAFARVVRRIDPLAPVEPPTELSPVPSSAGAPGAQP